MAKITLFVRFAKRNPNHDACNRQLAAAVAGRQHSAFSSCWQLLLTFRGGKKLVDTIPPLITGFLTSSTCVAYNLRHATLRPQASWEMHWKQTKGALLIIPLGWCWSLDLWISFETESAAVWRISLSVCVQYFHCNCSSGNSSWPFHLHCGNMVSFKKMISYPSWSFHLPGFSRPQQLSVNKNR